MKGIFFIFTQNFVEQCSLFHYFLPLSRQWCPKKINPFSGVRANSFNGCQKFTPKIQLMSCVSNGIWFLFTLDYAIKDVVLNTLADIKTWCHCCLLCYIKCIHLCKALSYLQQTVFNSNFQIGAVIKAKSILLQQRELTPVICSGLVSYMTNQFPPPTGNNTLHMQINKLGSFHRSYFLRFKAS